MFEDIDFLSKDYDVNAEDIYGNTCLHIAIKNQDIIKIQTILKCLHLNINKKNVKSQTPLIVAAKVQNNNIIKLLIDNNCDINSKDETGCTALMYSAKSRNLKAIKLLASQNNCDVNISNKYRLTALHEMAKTSHFDIFVELINRGANVDALDKWNNTPLMYATLHNNLNNVEFLLKKGCKTNITNKGGRTALHTAAEHNLIEFADKFLKFGACPNILDFEKSSPALIAAKFGYSEILQMMIDANCDVLNIDSSGKNIFHYACFFGLVDIVNQLLSCKYKIDAELKDCFGNHPLFLAVLRNQVEIVKILLNYNCNPNQEAFLLGNTTNSFTHAFKKSYVDICLLLIESGADLNRVKYKQDLNLDHLVQYRSIVQNHSLICSLKKLISNCPSLQILCRNIIRRSIGQNIYHKLDYIRLPNTIKTFLLIFTLD